MMSTMGIGGWWGALILIFCILVACNTSLTLTPTAIPVTSTPTVKPTSTSTALPQPSPTAPLLPQPAVQLVRPQIALSATLDYAARRLQAQQTITYTNHTGIELPHLALDTLAARRPGVFTLINAQARNNPAQATLEGTVLKVALSQPLAPEATTTVTIEYALDLPPIPPQADGATGTLGWSARQVNLGDWFPAVSAYRAGWLAERNPPHVVGETTAPEAVDLNIDLAINNAPAGLKIIASAPAKEINQHYRFSLNGARSFALSLSTEFELAQAATPSGVLVQSAYFHEHAAAGKAALQIAAAAVELYAARYGPYQYRQLAIVEADFFDGMEYSGFYFLGGDYYASYDGTPRNYFTAIAAHEVAHQWWYAQVGNDQAREPWLDESLCIYSELIYYQAIYPDLVDWWWDLRVNRFKPTGWVNSSVYDFNAFRPYVNAVYLRGALFWRDLRAAMGDAAFFEFVQRYLAAQAGQVATANDFWTLLESYNVPDLARLRAAYFR